MTSKELWEKEQHQVYREFLKEYLAEGYDMGEAKALAKQDTKEVMQDKLDFVEDMIGSYFKITNPKATSTCGCGTSFSI